MGSTERIVPTLVAAVVFALALSGTATSRSTYQSFSNPTLAAKRLSASARAEGIRLFHPCAIVNPYLIRCGGYVSGLKPLTDSGKLRMRIDWRKVNPYMLEKTVYAMGGVFQHLFVDTKVAY